MGRQKAPSAIRCIKTRISESLLVFSLGKVRKHRAPKGALRHKEVREHLDVEEMSESTKRQKVH